MTEILISLVDINNITLLGYVAKYIFYGFFDTLIYTIPGFKLSFLFQHKNMWITFCFFWFLYKYIIYYIYII